MSHHVGIILGAYSNNLAPEREKSGGSVTIFRIAMSVLDKCQNMKQKMNTALLPADITRNVSL